MRTQACDYWKHQHVNVFAQAAPVAITAILKPQPLNGMVLLFIKSLTFLVEAVWVS